MRWFVALAIVLFMIQPVAAQAEGFLLLGEDAGGDQNRVPDTLFDILSLDVATEGEELVFFLGLAGDTTEIGQACPVVAFQVGATEYLAFDCFECAAYQCTNAASGAQPPSSSRGSKVGTVTLGGGGATMRVAFSEIGVGLGDQIDDIYGLTYVSRALVVEDAAPDAKSSAGADESFGSYVVGFGRPGDLLADVVEAVSTVYEDLAEPRFSHAFTNATTAEYMFNFTSEHGFGLVDLAVNGTGFANATLVDAAGVELFNGTLASGITEYQNFTAGNWSLALSYTDFNGTLDFAFLDGQSLQAEAPDSEATGNATTNETLDDVVDEQEAPGIALPLLLVGLIALVRRRN